MNKTISMWCHQYENQLPGYCQNQNYCLYEVILKNFSYFCVLTERGSDKLEY